MKKILELNPKAVGTHCISTTKQKSTPFLPKIHMPWKKLKQQNNKTQHPCPS